MVSELFKEHDHILKMLNLLEGHFLNLCRGRTLDYSVMLSVIVYIQEFPEQVHHPLEDAIFSFFIKRGGKEGELARALIKDHTELEGLTRILRESIESLMIGSTNEEFGLNKRLSMFLERQRRHIYAEEASLYPLINDVITKKNWKKIKSVVPDIIDPVFDERTRSEYEQLYREIEG